MEALSGDISQVSEVFGFAIPGYALALIIGVPLALRFPSLGTFWAAVVAVSGLPIGFVWIHGVYSPLFWAGSRSSQEWIDLVEDTGNRILCEVAPTLSDRGRENLAKLQQDEQKVCLLMERASSKLREDHPFLATFHVRHHILRNLAYVLCLLAVPFFSGAFLADLVARGVSMRLVIPAEILLILLAVSKICFISADREFKMFMETFRFRFALHWQDIAGGMMLCLESPVPSVKR